MQSPVPTEFMRCIWFKKADERRFAMLGRPLYITRYMNHFFDVVSEILYRCLIDVRTCSTSASSSPTPKRTVLAP